MLTYTAPYAAADALRWRASLISPVTAFGHLAGAAFPWRVIRGGVLILTRRARYLAINTDIAMASNGIAL